MVSCQKPESAAVPDLATVTPYGRTGASSRVRVFDWLDHLGLRARRFTYLDTSDLSPSTLKSRALEVPVREFELRRLARFSRIDRLVVSRNASPLSRGGLEVRLLRRAAWGVYDFDDALYDYPKASGPLGLLSSKSTVWQRSVVDSDLVIAGSEILADHAADLQSNVVMIPSCVEPGDYLAKTDHETSVTPVMVWLGSPTTETYLHDIATELLQVHARTGARLKLISGGEQNLGKLAGITDRVAWRADTYAAELAAADVGIAPLRDTTLARGKCAYKILQYGATGLPIVGSPIGANRGALHELGALAPETPGDWASALLQLLEASAAERQARGEHARRAVNDKYSYAAWADEWLRATRMETSTETKGERGET